MRLIYSLLLMFGFAAVSHAKPISFTFHVEARGSIANIGGYFDSLTFRSTGDTDNLIFHPDSNLYRTPNEFAEIQLGDIGAFPLPYWRTGSTYSEVGMQAGRVEFSYKTDQSNSTGVSFDLGLWDMKSSYGPVTGITTLYFTMNLFHIGSYTPLDTWIAAVVQGGDYPLTFTAIVTPEPSSICLCIGSIVLLGIRRRR